MKIDEFKNHYRTHQISKVIQTEHVIDNNLFQYSSVSEVQINIVDIVVIDKKNNAV